VASVQPHLLITPRPLATGTITDLEITRIGHYLRREAPGTDSSFPYRSLVFLAAGSGIYHAADGTATAVGPGSMWCLNPGHRYRYAPRPGGWWEEFYIDLAGPGLGRWYQRGWLVEDPRPFRLAPVGPLVRALQAVIRVMQEGTAEACDRSVLLVEQLLFEMFRSRTGEDAPRHDPQGVIAAAISHLHQRYGDEVDFARLARQLGISLSVLRRGILALTGEPPARYLRAVRCEVAKKLLAETALPVQRIASEVGIPDSVVFSRIFRRHCGAVPTRWRQDRS
jgi:AraC family transcriptional regulator of arabinose operon